MRKERIDILFLMAICAIMVGFGAAIFVLPPKSFSQKENRTLDQMPSPELSGVLSGSYFRELNGFYQDQFPLRDRFTELYALCEKGLGKIETNGVITTSDGVCVAAPNSISTSKIQKNLDAIVANNVGQASTGFASDDNKIDVILRNGEVIDFPQASKKELATLLIKFLSDRFFK